MTPQPARFRHQLLPSALRLLRPLYLPTLSGFVPCQVPS